MNNVLKMEFQLTQARIVFCYGTKAYSKYIRKRFGVDEKIEWSGCSLEFVDGYEIVVGVRKYKDIYALRALIVHELSHAVSQLMEYYNFNCDELTSYTLQWLYKDTMIFIDEQIKLEEDRMACKAKSKSKSPKPKK